MHSVIFSYRVICRHSLYIAIVLFVTTVACVVCNYSSHNIICSHRVICNHWVICSNSKHYVFCSQWVICSHRVICSDSVTVGIFITPKVMVLFVATGLFVLHALPVFCCATDCFLFW